MTGQKIRAAMALLSARRPAGVAVGFVCCVLLQRASSATSSLSSVYSGDLGSDGRIRSNNGLSSAVTVAPETTTQLSHTSSARAGTDFPASRPAAATTAVIAGTPAEQEGCQLHSERSYEPLPAAISAVVAACGCVMLLAGYRMYRVSFLIGGILLGAAVSYVALTESRAAMTLGVEATVCIVVGVGAVLGLCATLIPIVGHVLLAAMCGSVLSLTIFTVVAAFLGLLPVTVVAGVTAAAGFAAGIVAAVSLRRPRQQAFATVICTAAIGAMLVLVCIDYFVELYLLLSSMHGVLLGSLDRRGGAVAAADAVVTAVPTSGPPLEISATAGVSYATPALYAIAAAEVQRLHGNSREQFGTASHGQLTDLCFYTWIVLAAWPLLTAIGALVQWKVTAKQVDNFTGVWCKTKSSRRASLTKTRGSNGVLESETAWKRFRNIYSARRSAGDVVATAYTKGSKKFSSVRRTPLHSETDDDTCLSTAKSSFKV